MTPWDMMQMMWAMKGKGKGPWAGMEGAGDDGQSRAKPGDWTCQACGNLNFSYRDKCNKCGEARGTNTKRMGMKSGDWICPNCGDLVFASKSACKMCGTPKPEDVEAQLKYRES